MVERPRTLVERFKDLAVWSLVLAIVGPVWAVINSKWLLVTAAVIGPPIYFGFRPQDFTPILDTIFSVLLFFLAYWIGSSQEEERGKQRATDRWLPQAESVVFRLLTLHTNVRRLCTQTRDNCERSECDLPELKEEALRAVRVKIKSDCTATADRLQDVAHQIEAAVQDWHRFISANCGEFDCSRIYDAIEERKRELGYNPGE